MPSIQVRTGRLSYWENGRGMPLVLLHANGHDHRDFDDVVPTLAQSFRTVALDWPGMGESDAPTPPSAASASLIADVLEDALDALDLPSALFIGDSVGGFAAARLAATRPERVRALVLVNSGGFTRMNALAEAFCLLKGQEWVTRWCEARFARLYLRKRTPLVNQMIQRIDRSRGLPARVAVNAAVWRSFSRPESNPLEQWPTICAPTLLVWGRHDPVSRARVEGQTARRSIPGARYVELDTGHVPFAEDPSTFLAHVQPFLHEVARGEGG